jgi:hypothetical protein
MLIGDMRLSMSNPPVTQAENRHSDKPNQHPPDLPAYEPDAQTLRAGPDPPNLYWNASGFFGILPSGN